MNTLRRAFTLVELLVVIAIFTLLLAIGVPAFSSMLYSSEQSLAENALRTALAAARDAAARSPRGQDAAAVFFYDPTAGRLTIQPCITAGKFRDGDPSSGIEPVEREVFVPVPGYEATNLPRGWMIRGFAPAGSIDDEWYGDARSANLYQAAAARQRGNWLFPETAFYDDTVGDDGQDRQTFMIRFEGGTGALAAAAGDAALVFDPSPVTSFRKTSSPWNKPGLRADLEPDTQRLVRRILTSQSASLVDRQRLLGDVASDSVLTKPVGQLALYNEQRLAGGLRVRLDRDTDCLYTNIDEPTLVAGPSGAAFSDADLIKLNDWIQGFDSAAAETDPPLDSDCRIFTIQRYLGTLQEITGTRGGQGVGS